MCCFGGAGATLIWRDGSMCQNPLCAAMSTRSDRAQKKGPKPPQTRPRGGHRQPGPQRRRTSGNRRPRATPPPGQQPPPRGTRTRPRPGANRPPNRTAPPPHQRPQPSRPKPTPQPPTARPHTTARQNGTARTARSQRKPEQQEEQKKKKKTRANTAKQRQGETGAGGSDQGHGWGCGALPTNKRRRHRLAPVACRNGEAQCGGLDSWRSPSNEAPSDRPGADGLGTHRSPPAPVSCKTLRAV